MSSNNSNNFINLILSANDAGYSALQDERLLSIFIVATLLLVVSLIGNMFTVIMLCRKASLKHPTYLAILCISITDLLAVVTRYTAIQGAYFIDFGSCWPFTLVFTSSFAFMLCSAGQIVVLSITRYIMIVYPLESMTSSSLLTRKRILVFSLVNWVVSIAVAVGYGNHKLTQCTERGQNPQSFLAEAVWVTLTTSIPLTIIGILHVFKVRAMRKSSNIRIPEHIRRMSLMVTLVVASHVVSVLPIIVAQILFFCKDLIILGYWFTILGVVGTFALFTNYIVNPFLFYICSLSTRNASRTLSQTSMTSFPTVSSKTK